MDILPKRMVLRTLTTIGFLSTMPGHSMLQMAIGWRSEYEVAYGTDYGNNSSLVHYGDSFLFTLVAMIVWWVSIGHLWGRQLKPREEWRSSALAIGALLLGKVVDLIWEGRSFTGNYWLIVGALLVLLHSQQQRGQDESNSPNGSH